MKVELLRAWPRRFERHELELAAGSRVADALSAHGFAAHAERHGDELRIVSGHCPFGDVAIEHPVICAVDRGMVRGMLSSLVGETQVVLGTSVARGDATCVTDVQLL